MSIGCNYTVTDITCILALLLLEHNSYYGIELTMHIE